MPSEMSEVMERCGDRLPLDVYPPENIVDGCVVPAKNADGSCVLPQDEMVTCEDGRVLPIKKTVCMPRGNKLVPAGPRKKLTAALREEVENEEWKLRKAAQDGSLINLREQIEKGVDVNCRAQAAGATPLICAAIGGYLDVSKALIEAGANPSLGNGHCDTPLLVAAGWDRINLVSAPQAS